LELSRFTICSAACRLFHCEEESAPEFGESPDMSMEYDEFHEEVKRSATESGEGLFHSISTIPETFKQE